MTKEQLKQKAQELGIKNIEALTSNKMLEDAIRRARILLDAEKYGLEFSDKEDIDVIAVAVKEAKAWNQATLDADKLNIDIEGIEELEVIQKLVKEAKATAVTPDAFVLKDRGTYAFTDKTPEKFRFNDIVKNRAAWLKDAAAMEEMILGKVAYIKKIN